MVALRHEAPQTANDQLDTLITGACRLATARDDVRSVYVITNQRPTFHELMRFRTRADAHGLTLTMLNTGGVVLRRRLRRRADEALAARGIQGNEE